MATEKQVEKRAVVIYWKQRPHNPIELFSNLKNLCLTYPRFNYNTLNNYLGKGKTAYENQEVRIERKTIHSRALPPPLHTQRSIAPVVLKRALKGSDEKQEDLEYWLAKPPGERLSALTALVTRSIPESERMDKSRLYKGKNKDL